MSLQAKIEAVIYAAEEPVTVEQLAGLLGGEVQAELLRLEDGQGTLGLEGLETSPQAASKAGERRVLDHLGTLLARLTEEYATGDRGIELREVAGGFRMGTKPEYHDAVRGFAKGLKPPLKLTMQALETLAVVAYKQPITAPEVSEIRGVDSSGVLGSLMGRKLVTTAGRKAVIGRPMLYRTTRDFLLRFGLKDVAELPSIEEFEKLAGEYTAGVQGEIAMSGEDERLATEREREAIAPQGDGDGTDLGDTTNHNQTQSVDGRISGLPPDYDGHADVDPSAEEAAVQSGQ